VNQFYADTQRYNIGNTRPLRLIVISLARKLGDYNDFGQSGQMVIQEAKQTALPHSRLSIIISIASPAVFEVLDLSMGRALSVVDINDA